jgi:4-diphosphocytidyl-2-C-methyl-D-erythritol kinase
MVTLLAPAKINVGLRILERRPDGYHQIETLFLPLRLYDRLDLVPRDDVEFEIEGDLGPDVPRDDSNLAIRAAREVCAAGGGPPGLTIRLDKGIPTAAGLGGGSSDAAAVILGFEALRGSPLPEEDRHAVARALGADVPFFLSPRPAIGRGIGERIEALPGLPETWWLLVFLPFGRDLVAPRLSSLRGLHRGGLCGCVS